MLLSIPGYFGLIMIRACHMLQPWPTFLAFLLPHLLFWPNRRANNLPIVVSIFWMCGTLYSSPSSSWIKTLSGQHKQINRQCWRGCGGKGTLVHCWWECRLVRPLWKTVRNFLRKLKMKLPLTQQCHCWDYILIILKTNSKELIHPYVHSSTIYNSQVLETA